MPTITGRTKLPGGTTPLTGTWRARIHSSSNAAIDGDGTIRAGEESVTDIGDGATMTLPNGIYDFRFESNTNSSASGGKVHLGWYSFEITGNTNWGAIMETPVVVPVTPSDVLLAEQARQDAQDAAADAVAAKLAAQAVGATTAAQVNSAIQNDAATKASLEAAIDASTAGLGGSGGQDATILAIRNMLRGPNVATIKWVSVGDSTRDEAGPSPVLFQELRRQTAAGLPLEGMTGTNIVSLGSNGSTFTAWRDDSTRQAALVAANPDILEASWFTNDGRGGALGTTVAAIAAAASPLLDQMVGIRDVLPKRPALILSVPAAYLTTTSNPGVSVVTPQVLTDGLRAAYYAAAQRHPNVILYDAQTRVFGRTSLATSTYMADQLHPGTNGQIALAADLAAFVGQPIPFDAGRALQARASSPYSPWTVYARELETPGRYLRVGAGKMIDTNATSSANGTFIDAGPAADPAGIGVLGANIQAGDLVVVGRQVMFTVAGSSPQGAHTRFFATVPMNTAAKDSSPVEIYRRFPTSAATVAAARDATKNYKRYGVVDNAGNGFVRIRSYPFGADLSQPAGSAWPSTNIVGDVVSIDGLASFTLTAAGVANGANCQFDTGHGLPAGDYSTYVGRLVVVTGAR